jgi:tetratricopeptide (TPR) repeat protein
MTHLFDDMNEGSELFVREEYEAAIRVFERVLTQDPENLMVTVRLAVAHSILGQGDRALELFSRAERIHPGSIDLQHYLAMHYFRSRRWDLAAPLFEKVLAVMPRKLPALEALARIRESENRFDDAARLMERIVALKEPSAADWIRLGELEMAMTDTPAAIRAFEEARRLEGEAFDHYLELGVCYLDLRSYAAAAEALDLVSQNHPGYAMALFKRAQVSVLLGEPDWRERVRFAYDRADPSIRQLGRRNGSVSQSDPDCALMFSVAPPSIRSHPSHCLPQGQHRFAGRPQTMRRMAPGASRWEALFSHRASGECDR